MSTWKHLVVVAGLGVTLTSCWAQPGQGPNRQAYNGLDEGISVANVATMAEAWRADVGYVDLGGTFQPRPAGHPVVSSRGVVNVATDQSLHGFAPATGSERWHNFLQPPADPYDPKTIATTADGRVAVGGPTGRASRRAEWFASSTGTPASGPTAGFVEGVREPTLVIRGRNDDNSTPALRFVELLFTGNTSSSTTTFRGWLSAIAGPYAAAPLTFGSSRIFYAGTGLMSTAHGDGTQGLGVRAFPVTGGLADCGAPGDTHFACPEWVAPLDGTIATSGVLSTDETTIYLGTDAGTLYGIDANSGSVQWHVPLGAAIEQPPALAGGTLYVPLANGVLVAVSTTDGSTLWSSAAGSELTVQPAVNGGVVFTGRTDGTLAAYDATGCGAATCGPLWSVDTGSRITGAPAVSLHKVFVGTADGHLIAYAPV